MKKLLVLSPLLGTLFTLILTNIIWEENPYGEIREASITHWEVLIPIILASWILSTLAAFAALLSTYLLYRALYHAFLRLINNEND